MHRLLCFFVLVIPLLASISIADLSLYTSASPKSGLEQAAKAFISSWHVVFNEQLDYQPLIGTSSEKSLFYYTNIVSTAPDSFVFYSSPLLIDDDIEIFDSDYRDLIPVARVMLDYSAIVVRRHMYWFSFNDLLEAYQTNPDQVVFGGGSRVSGFDHIVSAWLLHQSKNNSHQQIYRPYPGGGAALSALRSGEIDVLTTSLSEALPYHRSQQVRILCTTAPHVIDNIPPCHPEVVLENWRGMFVMKDMPNDRLSTYQDNIQSVLTSSSWQILESKYGWVTAYLGGEEFAQYLSAQHSQLGAIKNSLGWAV